MSKSKITTVPDLIETSIKHKAAIANKDHFIAWQYNVADHLKNKTVLEIKKYLKDTAYPFAIAMENLIGDFNLGTVIRNANAFNAKEVFYLGNKKWDRRGAVGAYNYIDVTWLSSIEDFIKLKEKYTIIGVDNIPGKSVPLQEYNFTPNSLFVFGEEGVGLTETMQSFCKDIVEIEQFGSVRSLNCGVASGIIMHEFVSRFRRSARFNK